jgi:hypothetical protein
MDIRALVKSVVEMPVKKPDYLFIFPFGKYRGSTMDQVDSLYLSWWGMAVGFPIPLTRAEHKRVADSWAYWKKYQKQGRRANFCDREDAEWLGLMEHF